MSNNISWDLPTKDRWNEIMQEHQTADRFIQGNWLSGVDDQGVFRGCFFGCAMQSKYDPLEKAIQDMNLPPWLIYLAEKIFEGLPVKEAKLFPVQLLKTIPVDTDLSGVECKQHISRLNRLLDLPGLPDNVISSINGAKDCWTQRLHGIPESDINWTAAAEAAWSAEAEWSEDSDIFWSAAKAAKAAVEAWVAEAVEAWVAEAVEWSAKAAWSAEAATARAAWSAAWKKERDVLIQLLSEVSGE